MINFFRNIRRQLANENKFQKYFRYAFGEIVLVVIGILIALQINNWNENRKQSNLELSYLESIKNDLKADIKYYDKRIAEDQKTMDSYYNYIQQSYNNQKSFEEFKELNKPVQFPGKHLTIQNFTYTELVNGGALGIIQDKALKDSIVSLYKATEEAAKHIKEFNEFTVMNFMLLKQQPDLDFAFWSNNWEDDLFDKEIMFKDLDWSYINDPNSFYFKTIRNTVRIYYSKLKLFKYYFKNLKAKSIETINLIQQELDKRQ